MAVADEVIRDALEWHRHAQQSPDMRNLREEQSSQELQRRLLDAGIISEIKPPITDLTPHQNRQAVHIQGDPISETAIRERR